MSKAQILDATCVQSVVKVDTYPVQSAEILSEGQGQSSGVLIMFGEKAYYVPKASGDLKSTLENLVDTITTLNEALTKISTTLSSLGAAIPTATPPPTLAADVAEIVSKVTALNAIKAEINTLKGALV